LCLPLAVLAAAELGMRLAGYGYPTTFFVPTQIDGKRALITNERFGWLFFPPKIARTPTPFAFFPEKGTNTCRIFLFGESAALGDPRPGCGVWRFLEVLLQERYPKTKFQVIPAAMTAVNSHALRLIAAECARLGGDAWVIYAGNNEMMGPYGAAGKLGAKAPDVRWVRLVLALKRFRLGQWLAAAARRLGGGAPAKWQGIRTLSDVRIPPDASARRRAAANFRANLRAMLGCARRAGAPVLLSTVAVNLRNCGPFGSLGTNGLPPARRDEWIKLTAAGTNALARTNFLAAMEAFQKAAAVHPQDAATQFRLARSALAATNSEAARAAFLRARDLDTLPFRADSLINGVVREEASEAAGFVDAAQEMGKGEPTGLPGEESFYEHVHLNFEGNYRLARVFAKGLAPLLPERFKAEARSGWADFDTCARRLGLTDWNRAAVYETMLNRIQGPPYTSRPYHLRNVASLMIRLALTRQKLQPAAYFDARAVYEDAVRRRPDDPWLRENFGEFLEANNQYEDALKQWEVLGKLWPWHFLPKFYQGRALARLKRYEEACAMLDAVLAQRPDFLQARLELGLIEARQGRYAEAEKVFRTLLQDHPESGLLYLNLGDVVAAQGRREEAFKDLKKAVELSPNSWKARYLYGVELAARDQVAEAARQFAAAARLRPDYPLAFLNLGVALAKLNRPIQAAQAFQRVLELDPQNQKAQKYLEMIQELLQKAAPAESPPAGGKEGGS